MKVFVTGVCGQLGHDVMNELHKRGHTAVGSDIAPYTDDYGISWLGLFNFLLDGKAL